MWQPVHEYVIVFFISGFVYYPQRKKYDKETEKKNGFVLQVLFGRRKRRDSVGILMYPDRWSGIIKSSRSRQKTPSRAA